MNTTIGVQHIVVTVRYSHFSVAGEEHGVHLPVVLLGNMPHVKDVKHG